MAAHLQYLPYFNYNMISKFLHLIKSFQNTIFLVVCIILVSVISYNIGRINALEKTPLKITKENALEANIYKGASPKLETDPKTNIPISNPKPTDLRVIASKKSTTKKFHYLWCSGAKQIKEENKLWFASAIEAQSAGYTLASNCEL